MTKHANRLHHKALDANLRRRKLAVVLMSASPVQAALDKQFVVFPATTSS